MPPIPTRRVTLGPCDELRSGIARLVLALAACTRSRRAARRAPDVAARPGGAGPRPLSTARPPRPRRPPRRRRRRPPPHGAVAAHPSAPARRCVGTAGRRRRRRPRPGPQRRQRDAIRRSINAPGPRRRRRHEAVQHDRDRDERRLPRARLHLGRRPADARRCSTAAGVRVVLTRPDDTGVGPCVDVRGAAGRPGRARRRSSASTGTAPPRPAAAST